MGNRRGVRVRQTFDCNKPRSIFGTSGDDRFTRSLARASLPSIPSHLQRISQILAIPMAMDVTTWMDAEVQITPADLFRALPVDPKDDGYSQSPIGHFEYVANVVIYAHRWLKRAHSLDEVRARPTAL